MPVPSAVIMARISSWPSILSYRAFSTLRIFPLSGRIAWYFRSRPIFAEPPADSPSTTNNSHREGSRSWQSASFPGRPLESMADLRRVNSRALRAASRARAASMHLPMTRRATVECFTNIIARDGDFIFLFLQHACRRGEVVDRARQRGAETGKVRAAVDSVNRVRESKNIFTVGIVVLQRDFNLDSAALALDVNRRVMQRLFSAIQVLDELRDAAGELEFRGLFRALIGERDLQALVQESQFAQALR